MKQLVLIIALLLGVYMSRAQSVALKEYDPENEIVAIGDEPNEGKTPLGPHEIPEAVLTAFENSLFQHMEGVQVFMVEDAALDEIIADHTPDAPLYLYEFTLRSGGKSFVQYFTPDGELYERDRSA